MRPDSASPSEKIMNMNRTIMKRNKHSRLAAALLSFLLLLSLMPTSVFATGGEGNTTPKITVGWRYDIGDSGKDYKVCEDAKRITLLSGNGNSDKVDITTLKQSDKVVFSVDVDPQYAEYTTYEWRHSLQQWNGTKPVITTVVYPNTGNTLSLTGIYAGSSPLLNKYLCTVRCTIEGVTYSCTINFRCKVTGENPLLAPAFCTQPESATYKQDESATPLTVAVDRAPVIQIKQFILSISGTKPIMKAMQAPPLKAQRRIHTHLRQVKRVLFTTIARFRTVIIKVGRLMNRIRSAVSVPKFKLSGVDSRCGGLERRTTRS